MKYTSKRRATIYDAVVGNVGPQRKLRTGREVRDSALAPEEALYEKRKAALKPPQRYEEADEYFEADPVFKFMGEAPSIAQTDDSEPLFPRKRRRIDIKPSEGLGISGQVEGVESLLPDSDLLMALHRYTSELCERKEGLRGRCSIFQGLDETALLAVGVLVEESVLQALGEDGDLELVERSPSPPPDGTEEKRYKSDWRWRKEKPPITAVVDRNRSVIADMHEVDMFLRSSRLEPR